MPPLLHSLDVLGRVALAAVLALPLGWRWRRSAMFPGVRTHLLASIAACGLLIAAREVLAPSENAADEQADVLAGVLSGVAVVSAAAFFRGRRGLRQAHGVAIWVTAAMGAAVAYGLIGLAVALSLLSWCALRFFASHGDADTEAA